VHNLNKIIMLVSNINTIGKPLHNVN
jgi:hypothetical protein